MSVSVGRNQPCPCGSGKKYKKCCGLQQGVKKPTMGVKPVVTQNLAPAGFPGVQQHITGVPIFPTPSDPRNRSDSAGQPGLYDIVFTLNRPGYSPQREHEIHSEDQLEGDSHLAVTSIAHPAARYTSSGFKLTAEVAGEKLTFVGHPNRRGSLGKFSTQCEAKDFRDAHWKCFKALGPWLSNWSLQLDIPLLIYQTDIVEVGSGARRMEFKPPYFDSPLVGLPSAALNPEFRAYASLYREALNSNSSVYQFLCYFKIVESIRDRRNRLGREARERGESFNRPPEVFPSTEVELIPWLELLFPVRPPSWDPLMINSLLLPETAGKRFGNIFENQLNPLRVSIAHALFESGELALSTDDSFNIETVIKWLPVVNVSCAGC